MSYTVKEIFHTLQGEGFNMGRAAIFCRFSGCNLWSGREQDRADAVCKFCDTDFVGVGPDGGKFATPIDLVTRITETAATKFVVFTGGEPLLQLDRSLIVELHRAGYEIAVETNGTIEAPRGLDWICVSPKYGAPLVQKWGDEFKLVYPQEGMSPQEFENLEFDHFYLQPLYGPEYEANKQLAITYCKENPRWRLSLQTHKLVGIR